MVKIENGKTINPEPNCLKSKPNNKRSVTMPKCKCQKCGHEWESRTKKPASCPACKTYKWDKKK